MRRKDREITDIKELLKIISECKICRLGLSDNNYPYVIPLNFGYLYEDEKMTLFFHSAKEGRKLDILRKNNNACFEIDCGGKLIAGEKPCDYSYEFRSIIGFGKIFFSETDDEKARGLNRIMKHQTGTETEHAFTANELNGVCVYRMEVEELKGKKRTGL
ncbi:MAG: pyridoxamine 5'-phosphate oxidase family protein [Treponema sp.]|nr:pyridoxamine 5'-phosphate oxidase family protein [Treponema sp.]